MSQRTLTMSQSQLTMTQWPLLMNQWPFTLPVAIDYESMNCQSLIMDYESINVDNESMTICTDYEPLKYWFRP